MGSGDVYKRQGFFGVVVDGAGEGRPSSMSVDGRGAPSLERRSGDRATPARHHRRIRDRLGALDKKIAPGLQKVNWTSSKSVLEFYMTESLKQVGDVKAQVDAFKACMDAVREKCAKMSEASLVSLAKKRVYQEGEFQHAQETRLAEAVKTFAELRAEQARAARGGALGDEDLELAGAPAARGGARGSRGRAPRLLLVVDDPPAQRLRGVAHGAVAAPGLAGFGEWRRGARAREHRICRVLERDAS